MSFDGPDQILPIFHHLMSFDGPKILMSFDGPKSRFSPFKPSCIFDGPIGSIKRHEVYIYFQSFPLSKPHVFWWTHYLAKTSCLLMDPKPHVIWWTLDDFLGPSIDMRFLGPPEDMRFWILIWVHQITWGFFSWLQLWLTSKNELILVQIKIEFSGLNR